MTTMEQLASDTVSPAPGGPNGGENKVTDAPLVELKPTIGSVFPKTDDHAGFIEGGSAQALAEPGIQVRKNHNSIDIRVPCERGKSKKFNRASSYQCHVDMEGWMQAFPQLNIADIGPRFSAGSFENRQGLKIATYSWKQPAAPRAAIVMFHSYTSYTLFDFLRHQPPGDAEDDAKEDETWVPKYKGSWIEGFYNLGMNVYAMDHQSHGRSEGWRQWRCNVEKFDDLVNDALQFLNKVATDPELPQDVPILLLGYSMGGNVVIQTLGRIFSGKKELALKARVNQAVLFAPLIKIKLDRKTEMLLLINRSLISCCLPNLRLSRDGDSGDCPFLDWWYDKDPFTYSGTAVVVTRKYGPICITYYGAYYGTRLTKSHQPASLLPVAAYFPGRKKSRMIASLYNASRKTPKTLSKFPPQLKLLCLQGTNDQTVDFRAPLKLYETPVKLDLLYLCGWSHYVPKHSGADKLLGLVITWVEKSTLNGRGIPHTPQFRSLFSLTATETKEEQHKEAPTS